MAADNTSTHPQFVATEAPPVEDNWTMCQRLARETNKDYVIQSLLVQIARMRKRNEKSLPLWSFVGAATSNGSGLSCAICSVYGVNSDSGEIVREIPRRT